VRSAWYLAIATLAVLAIYYTSAPSRNHVSLIVHALRGDQQWDDAASRSVLSKLILSQLSGGDENRWWLHRLDGLSRLPFDSITDRHDSLLRLAATVPERTAEWFPSPNEVGKTYERFLRTLVGEEQKRADLSAADERAFVAYQQWSNRQQGGGRSSVSSSDSKEVNTVLRLLRKSSNPGEAAKALMAFLPFKMYPGGLKEAAYSEPAYDEEVDYEKLGALVFAHRTGECDGSLQRVGSSGTPEAIHLQILTEVREYTLRREWLNEALLEEHRSTPISGEQFFGAGGSLHLLPTQVLVTIGPRYVASLTKENEGRLRPWINEGKCCEVVCNGKQAMLNSSRVFIDDHRLAGLDSSARADSFAVVSRTY
jgi:hypothetical protein